MARPGIDGGGKQTAERYIIWFGLWHFGLLLLSFFHWKACSSERLPPVSDRKPGRSNSLFSPISLDISHRRKGAQFVRSIRQCPSPCSRGRSSAEARPPSSPSCFTLIDANGWGEGPRARGISHPTNEYEICGLEPGGFIQCPYLPVRVFQ